MLVYHYTSLELAKKIVDSRVLLPSSSARCWRLLWATRAPTVDPTSLPRDEPSYARFTLDACDFESWRAVSARYQEKEMHEMVARMEQTMGEQGVDTRDWFVRYGRLPADRWLAVEMCHQQFNQMLRKRLARILCALKRLNFRIAQASKRLALDDDQWADCNFCARMSDSEAERRWNEAPE
jgi:hypothetical protein